MSAKTRRIIIVVGLIVLAGLISLGGFTVYNSNNPSTPESSPTPSPTATATDAQLIAANTTEVFLATIVEDIKNQTDQDVVANIEIAVDTSDTAEDGSSAAVAMINARNIPNTVNIEQNVNYINTVLTSVNDMNSTNWKAIEATDEFAGEENFVTAVKIWQDTDSPQNPAVVTIVYRTNATGYEIDITATVYLGNADKQ